MKPFPNRTLWVFLVVPHLLFGQQQERPVETCSLTTSAPSPLRLADGTFAFLTPTAAAKARGDWFVVGTPSLRWSANATLRSAPIDSALFGFVRHSSGRWSAIPQPIVGVHTDFSRVASDAPDRWHALIFASSHQEDGQSRMNDTVALYHAIWRSGRWFDVDRVGTLIDAKYRSEYASDLIVDQAGNMAFALPLLNPVSSSPAYGGVILIHFDGRRWQMDTLRVRATVRYASLARGPRNGAWSVLYQGQSAEPTDAGSLYVTTYSGRRWSTSEVAVRGVRQSPYAPKLYRLDGQLFASWTQDAQSLVRDSGTVLRWTRVGDGTADKGTAIVATHAEDIRATPLGSSQLVWAARDSASSSRVRLFRATKSVIDTLGTVSAPNETTALVLPLDSARFALLTARLGRADAEMPVTELETMATLTCRARPSTR